MSDSDLHSLREASVDVRLEYFRHLLDVVADKGSLTHWKMVDMSLLVLATTLEEKGLKGLPQLFGGRYDN